MVASGNFGAILGFDLECVSQFGLDVGRLKWCFVGGMDFCSG